MNPEQAHLLAQVDARLQELKNEEQELEISNGAVQTPFGLRWPKDHEVPLAVDIKLSKIREEYQDLWNQRWDLRKSLKLDPRTGQKPVKAPPMQTLDEGYFPELLGPIAETSRGKREKDCHRIRTGNPHIIHEACDDDSYHLIRFLENPNSNAVSGLSLRAGRPWQGLQSAVIAEVFTHADHRRQGFAAKLLEYARTYFRKVEHSKDLTTMGAAWKKTVKNPVEDNPVGEKLRIDGWLKHLLRDKSTALKIATAVHPLFESDRTLIMFDKPLGCGSFGCAFPIANTQFVLKITRDPTEGPMQAFVAKEQAEGAYGYDGFAIVKAVFRVEGDVDWRGKRWPVYAIVREEIEPVFELWRNLPYALGYGAEDSERIKVFLDKMSPRPISYRHVSRAISAFGVYQTLSRKWAAAKRERTRNQLEAEMSDALMPISDAFPYISEIMGILQSNGMPLQDVHLGNIGIRKHGGLTDIDPTSGIGNVVIFDPGHTKSDRTAALEGSIARLNLE